MALPLSPYGPATAAKGVYRFDDLRAQHAVDFIEKIVCHTKGRFAGKPFILTDWQREEIVRPLFGTISYDDQYKTYVRQFRIAWLEMARKNGKSELLSAFALLGLVGDGEESAEVYSVAADKDQAGLVYAVAKRMVELSPILSKRLIVVDSRKRIVDPKTNSFYQVLPGDAGGALGTNPSMVLFDEVLTQRDRHLWDAMRQGFGTRKAPIMIAATTAAYTSAAFALEEHEYGERITADPNLDPARFVFMRNLPTDADWTDEGLPPSEENPKGTGWHYANPALGDFLNINTLRAEAQEAALKPTAQNALRVFRLNQWVSQASRWLDMTTWDGNGSTPVSREALLGRPCFGGFDLASTADFTAWVLLFPGSPDDETAEGFTVLPHFWLPRSAVDRRSKMQTHLEVWERNGLLTVTEGDTTDYDAVEAHVGRDAEAFQLRAFGYDPWNTGQIVQHLEDGGLLAVKVPQTAARLNDPSKHLETLLANRHIQHGGNPVLRWNADNVELDITGDGLIKPSKAKSGDKIDGIAGLINALFVSVIPVEDEPEVTFISFDDGPDDDAEQAELLKLLGGWNDSNDDDDD